MTVKNSAAVKKTADSMRLAAKSLKDFPLVVVGNKPRLVLSVERRDELVAVLTSVAALIDDLAEVVSVIEKEKK